MCFYLFFFEVYIILQQFESTELAHIATPFFKYEYTQYMPTLSRLLFIVLLLNIRQIVWKAKYTLQNFDATVVQRYVFYKLVVKHSFYKCDLIASAAQVLLVLILLQNSCYRYVQSTILKVKRAIAATLMAAPRPGKCEMSTDPDPRTCFGGSFKIVRYFIRFCLGRLTFKNKSRARHIDL